MAIRDGYHRPLYFPHANVLIDPQHILGLVDHEIPGGYAIGVLIPGREQAVRIGEYEDREEMEEAYTALTQALGFGPGVSFDELLAKHHAQLEMEG